ncbi:MAG: alkaline phosphatase family protein [Microbacterium sp.]|uniref:alkaline phosphatase family protein n=1 Tax=Microbacterium sp. TaxID=51671 RepID=UPI0026236D38|nr:nucleotide pyrophosphatase/phosphodiesterase family protein [Microbacterium sp.]MCX6501102.1 alkaline phosphatase family protein [Microbacterium sp.]
MSLSLPAQPADARSLTDVVPIVRDALGGTSSELPPARSGIVFVVDGLGARNLSARRAHGRFLAAAMARRDVARTVFPSTTAAALTSLLTATWPGEHGVVGYRARVPETGEVVNQLNGWDDGSLDPMTWQRAEPLFAADAAQGRPCFAVSKPEYADSGFTRATLRGAEIHGVASLDDRIDLAAHIARTTPGSLTYLYAPELDTVGHRRGAESDEWAFALEALDAGARRLHEAAGSEVGVIVTADHGMVDVPAHRQVLFGDGPLTAGLQDVGGEPRMLHLYAEPGAAGALHTAWLDESSRAWVMARDEAIDAGVFGPVVADAVRARIGDVLVAARGRYAYYDDRVADTSPRRMVGQHGSLTDEETAVPFIRLGAFAR